MTSSSRIRGRGGVLVIFLPDPHVVAVRQPVIAFKSVLGRQEFSLVAAMPFADNFRGIAGIKEQIGDGNFRWIQSDGLAGKEYPAAVKSPESYPGWVAARHHGPPGGGTDRGRHIEISKTNTFFGKPVNGGCFIDRGFITSQVTIP